MDGIMVFALGFVAIIAFMASLWYLIQTTKVMWGYSSLLAVGAVILSPIIHIVFYLFPKEDLDEHEKGLFKRYFLSIGLLIAVGVVASVSLPMAQPQALANNEAYDSDSMQPLGHTDQVGNSAAKNMNDHKLEQDVWLQEQIAEDDRQRRIDAFLVEDSVESTSFIKNDLIDNDMDATRYDHSSGWTEESLQPLNAVESTPTYSQQNNTTPTYSMPASTTSTPISIVNCDVAGCWDTNGTRYNKGAGDTYFPSTGGSCQNIGGQMQCS